MLKSYRVSKQKQNLFMKSTFRIIVVVLVATFYGCQKSDVSPGVSSSVTIDGVFSGTIVNDSNWIDSIIAYGFSENILDNRLVTLGKSAMLSNGKFSLVLTNPVLNEIGSYPSGVVVSDTTAMIGYLHVLGAFKSGIYTGFVYKANYNLNDSIKAGESESQFMYSDRIFTIKGTDKHVSTYNSKVNYNITIKKGWNEIVWRVVSVSNVATEVETVSNTVTSDLQWRYYPNNNASSVRAKTRGIHSIARPRFLFQ